MEAWWHGGGLGPGLLYLECWWGAVHSQASRPAESASPWVCDDGHGNAGRLSEALVVDQLKQSLAELNAGKSAFLTISCGDAGQPQFSPCVFYSFAFHEEILEIFSPLLLLRHGIAMQRIQRKHARMMDLAFQQPAADHVGDEALRKENEELWDVVNEQRALQKKTMERYMEAKSTS